MFKAGLLGSTASSLNTSIQCRRFCAICCVNVLVAKDLQSSSASHRHDLHRTFYFTLDTELVKVQCRIGGIRFGCGRCESRETWPNKLCLLAACSVDLRKGTNRSAFLVRFFAIGKTWSGFSQFVHTSHFSPYLFKDIFIDSSCLFHVEDTQQPCDSGRLQAKSLVKWFEGPFSKVQLSGA